MIDSNIHTNFASTINPPLSTLTGEEGSKNKNITITPLRKRRERHSHNKIVQ